MLKRFLPHGLPPSLRSATLPYSDRLEKVVLHAVQDSTSAEPSFPELVKPFQERVGSLMYACNATRCDIAFPVHTLCRAMSRPTPECMLECDRVFAYLSRHSSVGLTFGSGKHSLHGFADASWEVKNSTSGWLVKWQNSVIAWGSRKQKCVALSDMRSRDRGAL